MRHHLHMPSYFLGTFTEYPRLILILLEQEIRHDKITNRRE